MLFISYRRQDSGSVARRLADTLARVFGAERVFIDTDSIRTAQDWQARINQALEAAAILLVIIGPRWIYAQDEDGRRRIDLPDDWVRNEILEGIRKRRWLFPILVSGATMPSGKALPEELLPLAAVQAYDLREEYWERDTAELIKRLEKLGLSRLAAPDLAEDLVYPARIDRSAELTEAEQEEVLARLPEWRVVNRPGVQERDGDRRELYRAFRFKSFEDAIHFMSTASRFIAGTGHHPDWQNLWINVRVWLSTWDIGHRLSYKDVRLAEYLEKLYRDYTVS